jgi:hypothetical protein
MNTFYLPCVRYSSMIVSLTALPSSTTLQPVGTVHQLYLSKLGFVLPHFTVQQ